MTMSVGLGQITLAEAFTFREKGLIDFDPTFENIQDPERSIQLMAAKLKTVEEAIANVSDVAVSRADRMMLLLIGQNYGAGIVDTFTGCKGDWACVFQKEPWAEDQLLMMQREIEELRKRGWPNGS